jgi:AcrR family transcriptional regulator
MLSVRRDPRAERSRAALRDALSEMLSEMPMEQVTVLAVTARAGVGYATFFRNYESIDDLLADLAGALITELAALLMPLAEVGTLDVCRGIARFADERQSTLRPLFVGASATLQREITVRALATARRSAPANDTALPRDLAVIHTVSAVINTLAWWLQDTRRTSHEHLAGVIHRLAFLPIAPQAPKKAHKCP